MSVLIPEHVAMLIKNFLNIILTLLSTTFLKWGLHFLFHTFPRIIVSAPYNIPTTPSFYPYHSIKTFLNKLFLKSVQLYNTQSIYLTGHFAMDKFPHPKNLSTPLVSLVFFLPNNSEFFHLWGFLSLHTSLKYFYTLETNCSL
jgi:hypothetical protein